MLLRIKQKLLNIDCRTVEIMGRHDSAVGSGWECTDLFACPGVEELMVLLLLQ